MDNCFCENLSSRQVISDDFFAERFCMKNGKIELERRKEMSKFSVKKPYTVFVAVVICLILGVVSFTRMSTDLLPEFSAHSGSFFGSYHREVSPHGLPYP